MTIDIVIVSVRRACFGNLISSIIKYLNVTGYELRLVLHVDYLDCYNTYNIESDIDKYSHLFLEEIVKIESENVGHTRSWLWCLEHIENDFIYMEDDKAFFRNMKLHRIINKKKNGKPYVVVSLEGYRGRLGNLESFYSQKIMRDYLLKHYPPFGQITNDAEKTNKMILKHQKFSYYKKKHLKCVEGTAMDNMAEHGLIRIRKSRNKNSPIYVPVPKNFSYILHGGKSPKNTRKLRNFLLCINSFPVFLYEDLDIDTITTSHVGILHVDCLCYARVTYQLDYEDIEKYDISGCGEDSSKLFYVKADIFRENYTEDDPTRTILDIWMQIGLLNFNEKRIQEWGFDL